MIHRRRRRPGRPADFLLEMYGGGEPSAPLLRVDLAALALTCEMAGGRLELLGPAGPGHFGVRVRRSREAVR